MARKVTDWSIWFDGMVIEGVTNKTPTQAQKYADKRYGRAMTITPVDATDEEKAKAKAESARSA